MKKCNFILLLVVFVIFWSGSCEHKKEWGFIVQNNSNKAIVIQYSAYAPVSQDTTCMKPTTSFEYEKLMHQKLVEPYSKKLFEYLYVDTFYIGAFYLTDINTMSCEEFKQKYPIKKEWQITLTDLEACDFNTVLEYTE